MHRRRIKRREKREKHTEVRDSEMTFDVITPISISTELKGKSQKIDFKKCFFKELHDDNEIKP